MVEPMTHPDPAAVAGPAPAAAIAPAQAAEVRPWRETTWPIALAALALGTAALLALFWSDCRAAVQVWYSSRTFNHCFLIGPISLYLIWERRDWLRSIAPVANFWALPLFPLGGLIWLIGNFANINEVQQLAVLSMFQALLLTILGARIYRGLLFPLLYLYFMVPTGVFLVPRLQDFTAAFIVHGLKVFGIPVLWDGVLITIPNGVFEVAEACAGLRFLIASIAFGFLFAFLMYYSRVRQLIFIVISIVIPIIANGFRAFGIVMLAHLTDNALAVGVDHLVYGWVFFSAITVLLIWVGSMFRDRPIVGRRFFTVATGPAVYDSPLRVALVALLALPLLALPKAYNAYLESRPAPANLAALAAPSVQSPWKAVADELGGWQPNPLGADRSLLQTYGDGRRQVFLSLSFYVSERRGAKIVASEDRFADETHWRRNGSGQGEALFEGARLPVVAERIQSGATKRLVWYWYWVDGHFTASALRAKLLQVKVAILGGDESAAVIAVATDYEDNPEDAAQTLRRFLADMAPISPILHRTSEQ